MVVFPNCKINLGLNIISKRVDGYHNLETVFYPIGIKDALEITKDIKQNPYYVNFSQSGLLIDGETLNNICVKAYHLLKRNYPQLPSISMHLHKVIPMGAGLGGGSADGAFALKLLSDLFHLPISTQELIEYSLQLGSDCPFFILNKPCFATGRGEVMNEIELDLSAYKFVIVNPDIHINTAWAFSKITPQRPTKFIIDIIKQPISTWKDTLVNDFEAPAQFLHPEIGTIKEELYNLGAVYSSMTGTGSTVFGIFEKNNKVKLNFPENYFTSIIDNG